MEVPLNAILKADSRLFQQVIDNICRLKHACCVKVHLNELAESRGIVILERLCVSEGL